MFWNKSVTVYNKSEDAITGLTRYYRHTFSNCFVKRTNNEVTIGSVKLQSDDTIVRIPAQSDYMSPYEWEQLPNDEKSAWSTFKIGDILVFGAVNDEIDETIKGHRATDLIEKYKTLGTAYITAVNDNSTGYPLPHYLIKGA